MSKFAFKMYVHQIDTLPKLLFHIVQKRTGFASENQMHVLLIGAVSRVIYDYLSYVEILKYYFVLCEGQT